MTRRIGVGFDWQGNFDRKRAFDRDAFSLLTQLADRTSRVSLGRRS